MFKLKLLEEENTLKSIKLQQIFHQINSKNMIDYKNVCMLVKL